MDLKVNIKQVGKKAVAASLSLHYETEPETLRELIEVTVRLCVNAYRDKAQSGDRPVKPLGKAEIEEKSVMGAITFGLLSANGAVPEEEEAAAVAIQGFKDGLYRVFSGEEELTELSEKPMLANGDVLTFVRMTMLAGRLW